MGKPCAHTWKVLTETIAFPLKTIESNRDYDTELLREWTQGVTRVLLTCQRCGELKREIVYGVG